MKQDRLLRRYVWMLSEANHTSDYRPNAVKEFMFHNKCKRTLAKLQDAGIPTRTFMREEYNNENIESHYKMILELIEKGIICSEDLKYIINGKAYLSNQQEGTYTINLEYNQKESADNYTNCRYFLGGYGYKIDDSNEEDIKIERIEL